ncbi:hypothetical protein, partial [Staphylococcus aureus]|uniref:hypothetical protein n=1 Tax=Staphylococcus aureus TaxID=1280 RepID=UPI001C8EED28
ACYAYSWRKKANLFILQMPSAVDHDSFPIPAETNNEDDANPPLNALSQPRLDQPDRADGPFLVTEH